MDKLRKNEKNEFHSPSSIERAVIDEASKVEGLKKICASSIMLAKCDEGLTVRRTAHGADIMYSEISCLARALLLASDMVEGDEISEKCVFEEFGIMLDMSRNAVIKPAIVMEYIRNISLMGYNALYLYMEDTFAIESEPYFGYMRGAYAKSEIKAMDEYAKIMGIELIPCIQTLAHINQIVRYQRYSEIVDCNDILLVGDEKTYELIDKMFSTLSESFSTRKINVGMDEAHMLGLGKYLDRFGYRERYGIMLEHLSRVREIASKYNFQLSMWSDMFFRLLFSGDYYGENIDKMPQSVFDCVPKDVRLVYWDYYHEEKKVYDKMLANHKAITNNLGFAGGAWKWMGFVPNNKFSFKVTKSAFSACSEQGIKNFMLTGWGDNGAEASCYSNIPAIFYASKLAYNNNNDRLFAKLFEMTFDEFMTVDSPDRGKVDNTQRCNATKFMLYNDPLIGTFDSLVKDDCANLFGANAEKIKASAHGKYAYVLDTMRALSEVLTLKATLGKLIRPAYLAKDKTKLREIAEVTLPKTLEKLEEFITIFYKQWDRENKAFGYEVQSARLGALVQRLKDTKMRLIEYLQTGKSIDELDSPLLPFAYFDGDKELWYGFNNWREIISPSNV